MAFIKVDLNALTRAINKLDSQIKAVEAKQRQILSAIDSIEGAWKGQDAAQFKTMADARMKSNELKTIVKGLKNQKRRLEDSKKLYQNAQNTALSIARTLR